MKHMKSEDITFLVVIAGRKKKDVLLSALLESGARLMNTIYGKGTVKASYLENLLGLIPEENKTVILCATTTKKVDAILEMLVERFHFDKPNTGVAFTVPIDRLSF